MKQNTYAKNLQKNPHVYNVILAGGGGSRLWPESREKCPKQFLKLFDNKTMIQITAERASYIADWNHTIVVTNQKYLAQIKEQLPLLPEENIILEPEKKDTALAMLVGTLYAQSLDPEAIIVNSAADHIVMNSDEYVRVMSGAVQVAAQGDYLVTVGITPTEPATGFGYIKISEQLQSVVDNLPVFKVDSFVEKPNRATAAAFIATNHYFWNANMYVWSAHSLLQAFHKIQPTTAKLIEPLLKTTGAQFQSLLKDIYHAAPSISIDYAISEKATNLVLIPGDFDWSDIGDWRVVYELNQKDLSGNVTLTADNQAKSLCINSHNNLISSSGRLVALHGVDDLVIIDTPEILMVIPKNQSQDVKKIVERLKEEKNHDYL